MISCTRAAPVLTEEKVVIHEEQQSWRPQGPIPPDATCLLASTDLLHLDAHVEGICEHTDELAEVHTSVSDVVEDRLVAITLIFDVPDLHIEAQRRGDLSSLDHRRLFTALGFLPALEVTRAGDAVDVEELTLVGAVAMVLHRQLGELTSEGHLADVVAVVDSTATISPL